MSRLLLPSLLLATLATGEAMAQAGFEGRTIGPVPRPELPAPLPAPDLALPPIPPPPPAPATTAPAPGEPTLLVRAIRIEGNRALTDQELQQVAAPYVGRRLAAEDLLELKDRLTYAYVERGYVNSGAVLPDQDVGGGEVVYRIVEGRLDQIALSGLVRLSGTYIEDRLRLGAGPPLNVQDLQERLQLLLLDPSIGRLNARLGPGDRPGGSRLEVEVEEAQPFRITGRVANDRSPDIGAVRSELELRALALTGRGDPLRLTLGSTRGQQDASFAYELPLNRWDTRFYLTGEINSSTIIQEELQDLDIDSRSRSIEAGVSHPVWQTLDDELRLSLGLARRHTRTTLLGEPFSSAPGIDDGESDVAPLRFGQDWQHRGRRLAMAARSTMSLGLPILGATENGGDVPDGSYLAWLGQVEAAARILETRQQLRVRASLQLARDPLLPLEQYAIGGIDTVRGYRENQLVRDNGWSVGAEYRIPFWQLPFPPLGDDPEDGWLELAPFFDIGGGWNTDRPEPTPKVISSLGLGLRWAIGPSSLAEIYYGYSLDDIDQPEDEDLQDHGIHFRLSLRFW